MLGQKFTSYLCCSLVVLELEHMVIKVMSLCDIASPRIQGLLDAYFKIKSQWRAHKRIQYLCEGVIE